MAIEFVIPNTKEQDNIVEVEVILTHYYEGRLPTLYLNKVAVLHIEPDGRVQFNHFRGKDASALNAAGIVTEPIGGGWHQLLRKCPVLECKF